MLAKNSMKFHPVTNFQGTFLADFWANLTSPTGWKFANFQPTIYRFNPNFDQFYGQIAPHHNYFHLTLFWAGVLADFLLYNGYGTHYHQKKDHHRRWHCSNPSHGWRALESGPKAYIQGPLPAVELVPTKWPPKGHGMSRAAADPEPKRSNHSSAKTHQRQQWKTQPDHPRR